MHLVKDWFGSPRTPRSPRVGEPVRRLLNGLRGRVVARLVVDGASKYFVRFVDGDELWLVQEALVPDRESS